MRRRFKTTVDFSAAFAAALKHALKNESKTAAAKLLGISRQALYLYFNGSSIPGADVMAMAFHEWDLKIAYSGQYFDKDSFPKPQKSTLDPNGKATQQLNLFEQLSLLKKLPRTADVQVSVDSLEIRVTFRAG